MPGQALPDIVVVILLEGILAQPSDDITMLKHPLPGQCMQKIIHPHQYDFFDAIQLCKAEIVYENLNQICKTRGEKEACRHVS